MKKITLLLFATLLAVAANAQELMWGLTGGLNVSCLNGKYYKAHAGFNVGAKAEYDIADPFFVEASALLSGKGFKLKVTDNDEIDKFKVDMWYLHVPMNFGYKFNINDVIAVAPKAGIYLALGLWGSDDNDNDPFKYGDNKNYADFTSDFNRFDFGFGLGANAWFAKHFEVSTGYEFGMVKSYKKDSNPRNWYLNIGFLF